MAGGISPLVHRRKLPAVIDEFAMGWPTVLASGGVAGWTRSWSRRTWSR